MKKAVVAAVILTFFSIMVKAAVGNDNVESHSRSSEERPKMSHNGSGRKVLEGVPKLLWGGFDTYTDDLMISSSLRLCLDYIGEKYSKAYLAGTSGAAFNIGWEGPGLGSGTGGAIFGHPGHFEAGIDNLFKAIGRKYTIAYKIPYKSEPQRVWDVVVQSIDAGRPVVAVEWAIDHFAVLTGYDTDKREFLGRRYEGKDGAPDEYAAIEPDALRYVLAIGEKTEKISPREAVLGAFRFAVSSARTGRVNARGPEERNPIYGPAAYTEHARMVVEQLDSKREDYGWLEHMLMWRLDSLHLARAHAVLYLQKIAELLSPSSRKHVQSAIDSYCELLGMLVSDNISTSTPITRIGSYNIPISYPHVRLTYSPTLVKQFDSWVLWSEGENQLIPIRELFATVEGRQRFADWLLKMRDVEEKAISALAKVLEEE